MTDARKKLMLRRGLSWFKRKLVVARGLSRARGYAPPRFSADEVWAEWKSHNKRCDICKRKKTLVMDHCHRTGEFRGFLCSRCNTKLGSVEEFLTDPNPISRYLDPSWTRR